MSTNADFIHEKHPSFLLPRSYAPEISTVSHIFHILLEMFYAHTSIFKDIRLNTNVIVLYTIIYALFSLIYFGYLFIVILTESTSFFLKLLSILLQGC